FTKAAEELSVTPAAVSHQVKALEALYGVSLFQRLTRALRLTEAGQAALPFIGQGLDKLAHGADQMRAHAGRQILTISVSPSFGAMWLVPRLEGFRTRHPEIEIRLDGTDRLATVGADGVDVAVRYGPGGYKGVRADFLVAQKNMPVCSPALLEGPHPLRSPVDLAHHTLLHIDWKEAEASWRMWLLAAGLTSIDPTKGPHYTMESMAVQAALEGQGVALVGDVLVADELAAGRLVRPFDAALNTPLSFSYYLISAQSDVEEPKVAAFRGWLLEEARTTPPRT
ncbi:MAG: transcriptional regulator GcvA, partial [Pseudomonadota bacterium]